MRVSTTTNSGAGVSAATRRRFRDVVHDPPLGRYQPGPKNGITDVPGVLVHTTTIREGDGAINTGATTILPRKQWSELACPAGIFRFNGAGEMTGSHWIEETGLLHTPIVISNTYAIGAAHMGILEYAKNEKKGKAGNIEWFMLPLVAETFDGHLNDLRHFAVRPEHVVHGISNASSDPLSEGNNGGGTGMMCHGLKGGNGTSSRLIPGLNGKQYTLGVTVQANYGLLEHLHMCGVPVGRIIAAQAAKDPAKAARMAENNAARGLKDGSIIVVIATDAPLHAGQLRRLAKRASVGLSRVGGCGHNSSGDIFLAFSTASFIPVVPVTGTDTPVDQFKPKEVDIKSINDSSIDGVFEAAADATEESIYNALCMAETMTGHRGHTVDALPLDLVADAITQSMALEKTLSK